MVNYTESKPSSSANRIWAKLSSYTSAHGFESPGSLRNEKYTPNFILRSSAAGRLEQTTHRAIAGIGDC